MAEYIKFDGKHLIEYELNGNVGAIPYDIIREKFDFVTKDEIEYRYAIVAGNCILFALTAYSGQAGLIAAWDMVSKELIHCTSAPFTKYLTLVNNEIWSISDVAYWGKPQTYCLDKVSFGIINSEVESETMEENIKLDETGEKIAVLYKGNIIEFEN